MVNSLTLSYNDLRVCLDNEFFFSLLFLLCLVCFLIFISYAISPSSKNNAKRLVYECGLQSYSKAELSIIMQGYKVVIVYLLFELEVIVLFPLVVLGVNNWTSIHFLSAILVFVFMALGYVYEVFFGLFEFITF